MSWIDHLRPQDPLTERAPASTPSVVAQARAQIGEAATAWAIDVAAEIVERVEDEFQRAGAPGMMTGAEREGCESCLLTTLIGFRNHTPASEITAPLGAQENVRLSVRQGVPIGNVLRTVWACHTHVQDELLSVLERQVAPENLGAEIRKLNAALFSYVNSYIRDLIAGFEDELSLWHGRLPAERRRIMKELLAGGEPSQDAEQVLGLRLENHHLMGIAWQTNSGHQAEREVALQRYAAQIAQHLGAVGTLVLHEAGTTYFWWTFSSLPAVEVLATVQECVRPQWMNLALGTVKSGLSGLQASYSDAMQAAKVGRLADKDSLWTYEKHGLLALLIADQDAAGRFVRRELEGLLNQDQKTADIRDTLRHYLFAGSSRIAAAQALHLATNTVAYRVKRAGEQLGRPAGERAVQTLLALELAHTFPQLMDP